MAKSTTPEIFEEKREYPRIVIDSPVNIHYKMQQLEARIHDISPDGLQIRTDSESLKKIKPDSDTPAQAKAPLLDVSFHLKLYEMDMKISALCEMYYSESLSNEENEEVACGLKFLNYEGDGSSQIEAFIAQEMSDI